ncbi:aspartate transaminase [Acephala macrosclerotiorum]|nr:aspartate transaminase [Acephala macrosclerotiorum]
MSSSLLFSRIPYFPPDAIFDLTRQFHLDTFPQKVNLGQGTYRDGTGEPWILPGVQSAKNKLEDQNHEYLPILGLPSFRKGATELLFGKESPALKENRVASIQSLSGTGALHLAGLFLKRYIAPTSSVYVSEPTWSNHHQVFSSIGFEVCTYNHYNPASKTLDFDSILENLNTAPEGSIFVLHACAHNPTGCDPSFEQWKEIARTMKRRNLFPLFDAAYLGINSGSFERDAGPMRYFVEEMGMSVAVCLSFAKNMGLYGERVGCVAIICPDSEAKRNTESVLEQLQRAEISNPPAYGARIAAAILEDSELREQWGRDLQTMSLRIASMRQKLLQELKSLGTPGDWSHVVNQTGMFCILGLSKEQVRHLQNYHHVYMAGNSRISVAGLNDGNVKYFAQALDETVRNVS